MDSSELEARFGIVFTVTSDRFTGEKKAVLSAGSVASNERGEDLIIQLSYIKTSSGMFTVMHVTANSNLGCSGWGSNYIHFLFDDGTAFKVENDLAKFNCGLHPTSMFYIDRFYFEGKTVQKIRFAQSADYSDYIWNKEFNMNNLLELNRL